MTKIIIDNEKIDFKTRYDKSLYEFGMSPILKNLQIYRKRSFLGFTNTVMYSHPNIEKIVLKNIEDNNSIKELKSVIQKGLDFRSIIVGYTDPGKFRFILNRLKNTLYTKYVTLGTYNNMDNTIYIILDNNINLFGRDIVDININLIHELCHMAAHQNRKTRFIKNTMDRFLLPYFKSILEIVLSDRLKLIPNFKQWMNNNIDKELRQLITNLVLNNEVKPKTTTRFINQSHNFYINFFNKVLQDLELSKEYIEDLSYLFVMRFINHMVPTNDSNMYTNKLISDKEMGDHLYEAYNKIGISELMTNPGQELIAPSEIVAIASQNGPNRQIISMIKKIQMGI